jgi:lysophospholipase L1-like esterase
MSGDNEIGCTVLIDGQPISDGFVSTDPDVPAVLSGLRVVWGRSTTVDQPQPSTCTFTVLDPLEGERLVPALTIGRRVDVRTDTVIYPPAGESLIDRMVPSAVSGATSWTVAADGKTATMIGNAQSMIGFYLPPLPFTSNPLGWDSVPRSLPGQSWRYRLTITPPAPWAGYAGWLAEVTPAYFTNPDGSDVRTAGPPPWTPCNPSVDATFTPPAGVWVGLAVHIYPVSPAWTQLDATPWDAAGSAAPVPAGVKLTAFGDSITAGTWLPTYADSWIAKLSARLGLPIDNRAVGGVPLHDPSGAGPVLMDQVTAALAAGQPTFTHAVILCGTNDLMTHDNATLSQSIAAAQAVQDALAAKGVRVIWLAVLPMGYGTSHRDSDLPTLLDRRHTLDNGLRSIAGSRWVDTDRYFGADPTGFVAATTTWLIDGLHPNPAGASQMADAFPLGILNPAYTGAHPTWDELSTFGLSGFELLAPAAGTASSALVFSGRITDVEARWDGGPHAGVQVIAQDWLAELANRYVGDQPWAAEPLGTRAQRIVSLSGQPIGITTDAGIAGLQVTYRDVDRQPATNLLQQLAGSGGGILWTATHLVTGQVMRIEDVNARPAALTLSDAGGLVHVIASPEAIGNALPITACDVEADPVRFILDMTDTVSMVAVTWLEQVTDAGVIKPAQRSVEVIAPTTLAIIGARRLSVSTQLTTEADATAQANSWLARSSTVGWRIEGLSWDTTGDLSPDEIASVMTLLDGTRRNGLPIALTDLPEWAGPMTHGQTEVALYVEGGSYEYDAGSWVLELLTSSATGSAIGTAPWNTQDADWRWVDYDPEVAWLDLYGVSYPSG